MINFQYINSKKITLSKKSVWLKNVITNEDKILGNVVYVFCNDNYLLEQNIKFLKHDYLTDIITFDYCKGNVVSGDILISTERVEENAKKYKVEFMLELDRVMVHGLLHLLGYNDKTKEDIKEIRQKEDYYLSKKNDFRTKV